MIYIKLSERTYLKEMPAGLNTLSPDNVVAINNLCHVLA
jgi:hypothetical protein